ncbi:hypothetical protein CARUB_v10000745mg [Capsella rubella]|uniref:Tify domain-containing protein n=1 Tax=Capsella rubella TaxID=81985 RepID=R0FEV4_9BRAS|nr:uncharacterized protein LOC17884222 [Capsella rubella]XP_006287538.1 uncharacterized protein LOC17884222 [Capsella rubella]XP_006287539.1 uncharacterized protein LOC17884222 [Capsella rubella]XP_023636768.1 uncharacterized protein LOC17884222 [Capsella rubella]XP_023636769.1 uncharacterized protein LOC17884222 [Capsella rubella]EOA20435.1 hypothetical protein CARUB_v10000745mg [Capsella rubella]EOA20436.1 hypothetical protein CARUB_v10000745mg [Capsella rubella]EOA20437.1 hypothetical pro
MTKDFGRQDSEEIPYSCASIMELKRSHQWLTEPSDSQLFGNKRQLVEIGAHMNIPAWDNSLVPSHLTNCLFDAANAHTSHLLGRNVSPLGGQHIEEEQCNNVSSIGLPVVHTVHDSTLNLDTIRNVIVNQVSEYGNIPEFMLQLYGGVPRSLETGQFASKVDGTFSRNFNNEGAGFIPMGDIYNKEDGNVSSTSEKGVENFVLMGQSLQKADCNILSMSSSYTKGHDSFMSLLSCDRVPENIFMTEPNYCKENTNMLSGGQSLHTEGSDMASMVSSQGRADETSDQISHKERSKTISFGDYQKETTFSSSAHVINSYENFSHDPATAKDPLHLEAEQNRSFDFGNDLYGSPRVDTLPVPKSKDSKTAKKGSRNTFPSNVKSLLSTGMFDGVTVKYYSWSREKNLKGIIKGTGYLCGCSNCNFNKVLNAYEFEQHANCKTKHPNNHIYFENGKTIYGVVQELKNTPQEKLLDAIQSVTGSDINHKNFNTWKASFQVASLELKRIYGKDAVALAS